MDDYLDVAKQVLHDEADAIIEVSNGLDSSFNKVISAIINSRGRVILCGMGKSGHIAKKIFATLVSTGTPSLYLHPAEGFHGDLGIVQPEDVFIAISNSGETEELVKLIPFIIENNNIFISITGNANSSLARSSAIHICCEVKSEACPLQLAPTSSTTAVLAVGDAIAISLMKARDFQPESFAKYHPGGSLGRKLLGKVEHYSTPVQIVSPCSDIGLVLSEMSKANQGIIGVIDHERLAGVITDGDIRRLFAKCDITDLLRLSAGDMMSSTPEIIDSDTRCSDADRIMSERSVNSLIVRSKSGGYEVYNNLNRVEK